MLTFRNQEKFVVDFNVLDLVRDWADGDDADERVRIDMTRKYAEDHYGLGWRQQAEIVKAFRNEKQKHRDDIQRCAGVDPRNGTRLFVFGELPR
jgi:hypothetical protein